MTKGEIFATVLVAAVVAWCAFCVTSCQSAENKLRFEACQEALRGAAGAERALVAVSPVCKSGL